MAASANGWRLLARADCTDVQVPGGVLPVHPRLAVVFADLATRWHDTVEPLVWPGCWAYAGPGRYIGKTKTPSNHWSGTAVDLNAPQHPQGVGINITFTRRELDAVHALEVRYGGVLVWGGRWTGSSVDAMHWEVGDGVSVEAVDRLTAQLSGGTPPTPAPAPRPAPAPAPVPAPAPRGWTGPDLRGTAFALRGEAGANGPRVRALQEFLRIRYPLYAKGIDVDGWWGPQTTAVIREFGQRSGVRTADGANIGPQLARKLHLAGFRG